MPAAQIANERISSLARRICSPLSNRIATDNINYFVTIAKNFEVDRTDFTNIKSAEGFNVYLIDIELSYPEDAISIEE